MLICVREKCFKRFINLVLLMLFTKKNYGYNADLCLRKVLQKIYKFSAFNAVYE